MNTRLMGLLVAAISIAAIMAGCGGDDDSGSAASAAGGGETVTTSSLSKAEYVKRASALCRPKKEGVFKKTVAYLERGRSEGRPEPVVLAEAAKAVLLPVVEARIAIVRKLGAPAGDEDEIEAMLVAQQEGVEKVRRLETFAPGEDLRKFFSKATKTFKAYKFRGCSYNL